MKDKANDQGTQELKTGAKVTNRQKHKSCLAMTTKDPVA